MQDPPDHRQLGGRRRQQPIVEVLSLRRVARQQGEARVQLVPGIRRRLLGGLFQLGVGPLAIARQGPDVFRHLPRVGLEQLLHEAVGDGGAVGLDDAIANG